MKNIVLTFNFVGDQERHFVIPQSAYNEINEKHNLKEDFFDEEQSPWGVVPTSVVVDLYEDAKLVEVESVPGELEYLMGSNKLKLEGKKLKNICVF